MTTSPTPYVRNAIIPILALLIISTGIIPLAAAAITVTPSKTEYTPSETLVVTGTATPNSAVTIQVYNPSSKLVGIGQGTTDATGQYSVTVFTWPSTPTLDIPLGIYSITATDAANGDVATTTVEYLLVSAPEEPPAEPVSGVLVQITVSTNGPYQLGDTLRIYVGFSYNGAKVDPTATVFLIHTPGDTTLPRSLTKVHQGLYYVEYTPTEVGTYAVHVEATAQGTNNYQITTFQVIAPLATEAGLETLASDLAESITASQNAIINRISSAQTSLSSSITSAQNTLNSAINSAKDDIKSSITSSENSIKSSISSIPTPSVDLSSVINEINDLDSKIASVQSDIKSQITSSETAVKSAIDGIQMAVTSAVTSAVQPLSGDITHVDEAVDALDENFESIESGVSAASTWIIVVGIIAAITLVLELVTLVRKLS